MNRIARVLAPRSTTAPTRTAAPTKTEPPRTAGTHGVRINRSPCLVFFLITIMAFEGTHCVAQVSPNPPTSAKVLPLRRPELQDPPAPLTNDGSAPIVTLNRELARYRFEWRTSTGEIKRVDKLVGSAFDLVIRGRARLLPDGIEYEYEFQNQSTSARSVHIVSLQALADASCVHVPSSEWNCRAHPGLGKVTWALGGTEEKPDGIPIGDSVSGFKIESVGLPTIVKCKASGATPIVDVPEDAPEMIYLFPNLAGGFRNFASGNTIGPAAVPSKDTLPIETLTRLNTDLIEARFQGWIGSESILHDLQGAISAMREALGVVEVENLKLAVERTCSFADGALNGEPPLITQEVHSLVTVNCRWLLRQYEK